MRFFSFAGGSLEVSQENHLIWFEFTFDLEEFGEDGAGFSIPFELQAAHELATFLQSEMRYGVRLQGREIDLVAVLVYPDEKHPDYIWIETDSVMVDGFVGEGLMLNSRENIHDLADFILGIVA